MTKKRSVFSLYACVCAGLILLLASHSSCNKKLSAYNKDFIGTWRTAIITDTTINAVVASEIVIEKRDGIFNNTCKDTCGERLCDCVSYQSGRAVINFSKDRIKIGSSSTYTLTINKEPYQDANGKWLMVIENLTYHKQ